MWGGVLGWCWVRTSRSRLRAARTRIFRGKGDRIEGVLVVAGLRLGRKRLFHGCPPLRSRS